MILNPGDKLGKFVITRLVGEGGMGEVYQARDHGLERDVAIKILRANVSTQESFRQRFENEGKILAALNHPNICTLYECSLRGETQYLVFEFLDGETLDRRLKSRRLPLRHALQFGIAIAEALIAAHGKMIVHCDLKPANVFLTTHGLKVLDFGLANRVIQAARVGPESSTPTQAPPIVAGTPHYMAPEQVRAQPTDVRTDVFALGSVLYEMLTGAKAFDGAHRNSVYAAVLKDTPKPVSDKLPEVSIFLERIIERCLAKESDDRWQNVRDLCFALKLAKDSLEHDDSNILTSSSGNPSRDEDRIDWSKISLWSKRLRTQLLRRKLIPDLIVGLGRGGAVAAAMIATKYNEEHAGPLVQIALLDFIYVGNDVIFTGLHHLDVRAKRVLLLVADVYSGTTLSQCGRALVGGEPSELVTGSIMVIGEPKQGQLPDVFGQRLPLRPYILPWRNKKARRPTRRKLAVQTYLVVISGHRGTGKTSVADALKIKLGYAILGEEIPWPARGQIRNPKQVVERQSYLIAMCWSIAAAGQNVVLEINSNSLEFRDQLKSSAESVGMRVIMISCRCPEAVSRARVLYRHASTPADLAEYDRVEANRQSSKARETNARNLLVVDTEELTFRLKQPLKGDVAREEMRRIEAAIKVGYFSWARQHQIERC